MPTNTKDVTISQGRDIQAHAAKVAAVLANVPAFVQELEAQANRKAEASISALRLCLLLAKNYDTKERATWPVPGSEYRTETSDGRVILNNNHDVYDTTDDNGDKAKGSFYGDILKGLPPGMACVAMQAAIKKALGNVEGADPVLLAKGDKELESMRNVNRTRMTNLKRNFVEAVELITAIDATNDMLDGVEVTIRTVENDDTMPVKNVEPVVVADVSDHKDARTHVRFYSKDSFLALSPGKVTDDTIKAHGGEWQAFVNTGTRKKKGEGDNGASGTAKVPSIKNTKQLENYTSELTAYLDNGTEDGKKHIANVLKMLADPKTGDDMVELFGNLCMATDEIWAVIGDRYSAIQARKASALKTKAAA